jgi:chromosome segregation protein
VLVVAVLVIAALGLGLVAGGLRLVPPPSQGPTPTLEPTQTSSPGSASLPPAVLVTPEAVVTVERPLGLVQLGKAIWVLTTGALVRIDPATNAVTGSVAIGGAADLYNDLAANDAGDIAVLPLSESRPLQTEDASGTSIMDSVSCGDRVREAVAALIGDVRVVPTLEKALEAASKGGGARYGTPDGHIVWPNGKVAVGPTTDTSSGVLARKRRLNELKEEEDAVESRVGDAEAAVSEAEEALSAAQQDALELGQRLAVQSGEASSLKEEIGRMELALTELDNEAAKVADRVEAIGERTSKDRPAATELKQRIEDEGERLEALEDEAVARREERDNRFRDEAAISTQLSTCQVDVATVSEREVFL